MKTFKIYFSVFQTKQNIQKIGWINFHDLHQHLTFKFQQLNRLPLTQYNTDDAI